LDDGHDRNAHRPGGDHCERVPEVDQHVRTAALDHIFKGLAMAAMGSDRVNKPRSLLGSVVMRYLAIDSSPADFP
jgi:hypothetical protein